MLIRPESVRTHENFDKEIKDIKQIEPGLKNTITEMKTTPEGINSISGCRRMDQPFGRQGSGKHPR